MSVIKINNKGCYFILITYIFLLSSCTSIKQRIPIKLDQSFQSMNVDSIFVLTLVDRRADRSVTYKGNKISDAFIAIAWDILHKKEYVALTERESSGKLESSSIADREKIEKAEFHSLGPEEHNFILIVLLDDLVKMPPYIKIRVSAILYAKHDKNILWHDEIVKDTGPRKMSTSSLYNQDINDIELSRAISETMKSLFLTLPDN